jgi:putative membrane protein
MGALELLHGVAGSSIGLMLGVYPEFVKSIRSIDQQALQLLRKREWHACWKKINGSFLFTLVAGILTGLFLVTRFTSWLELQNLIMLTGFLFGFVLISAILLLRKVQRWSARIFIAVIAGALCSYSVTLLSPYYSSHNYFFVLIAGGLSSLSMLIPGITGAFILVLIGKFQFIVTSFSDLNLGVIFVFSLGALAALWIASRIIYKILSDYYSTTVALLAGIMLGSLNRIWPWRKVLEYRTNSKGIQLPALDESILPWKYMEMTGKDPQVFQAILMIALGVFIVVLIDKIAAGLKTKF